jgi:acyl carrier protein
LKNPDVEDRVTRVAAELAPNRSITVSPQARLVEDLGFHSLVLLEMAVEIEAAFSLPPLDSQVVTGIVTVGDVVDLVSRLVGERTGL